MGIWRRSSKGRDYIAVSQKPPLERAASNWRVEKVEERFPEMAKPSTPLSPTEPSPERQEGVTQVRDGKEGCFQQIVKFAKSQRAETVEFGLETVSDSSELE